MFSSLKSLFRPGQGPRDMVMIDKAELERLRADSERAARYADALDRHIRALDAILALPPTVRVTTAQKIAREARNG